MTDAYKAGREAEVRVKPLVWEGPSASNNWIYVAQSAFGDYGIHICGGKHKAWLEAHVKPYEFWLGDGYVGSVLEAKEIAQADYAARIMAALDPAPAGVTVPQPSLSFLRPIWKAHGGECHGPKVERWSIPETQMTAFFAAALRALSEDRT